MKDINWNEDKNRLLKNERSISFEDVVFYIGKGDILDIPDHPNQAEYPNQRIFIIRIFDYIYLVPFVENETDIFLKTIIPSRKATKQYMQGE